MVVAQDSGWPSEEGQRRRLGVRTPPLLACCWGWQCCCRYASCATLRPLSPMRTAPPVPCPAPGRQAAEIFHRRHLPFHHHLWHLGGGGRPSRPDDHSLVGWVEGGYSVQEACGRRRRGARRWANQVPWRAAAAAAAGVRAAKTLSGGRRRMRHGVCRAKEGLSELDCHCSCT